MASLREVNKTLGAVQAVQAELSAVPEPPPDLTGVSGDDDEASAGGHRASLPLAVLLARWMRYKIRTAAPLANVHLLGVVDSNGGSTGGTGAAASESPTHRADDGGASPPEDGVDNCPTPTLGELNILIKTLITTASSASKGHHGVEEGGEGGLHSPDCTDDVDLLASRNIPSIIPSNIASNICSGLLRLEGISSPDADPVPPTGGTALPLERQASSAEASACPGAAEAFSNGSGSFLRPTHLEASGMVRPRSISLFIPLSIAPTSLGNGFVLWHYHYIKPHTRHRCVCSPS